ncbi:hypothetical protein GOV10_01495 [Candidatus Woesearchaeota archaeon]|nr:hypothetical protein [Candidatus Woesearchaeota archaeon]
MTFDDTVEEEFDIIETVHLNELKEGYDIHDLEKFEEFADLHYDRAETAGFCENLPTSGYVVQNTTWYENIKGSLNMILSRTHVCGQDESDVLLSGGHLLVSTKDKAAYEKFSEFLDLYVEQIKRE